MPKRTDPKLLEQAVAEYIGGDTVPVVAVRTGVAESVLYRELKARDIDPSALQRRGERGHANRRFSDEQEAQIASQYQAGQSLSTLGDEHAVNPVTIRNVLRRQEVERRARGNQRTRLREPSKGAARGERHGNWKGGRVKMAHGYIAVILAHDSPFAGMRMPQTHGYVLEHRLVMAQKLGRPLTAKETVHHINGVSDDNRPDNLQLRSGKHGKHEHWRCLDCGSTNIAAQPLEGN